MKKCFFIAAFLLSVTASAQVIESFDSNTLGWTEVSGDNGEAIIIDGKMHLVGKKEDHSVTTHCWAPIDVTKDFEIKCDVLVSKISDDKTFGLILNYYDDGNYITFVVTEGKACMRRIVNGRIVGEIRADIKLKQQKKASVSLSVKNTYNKLEFYINDMKALECRYIELVSCGMGLFVHGKEVVDFDNVEFIQ